MDNHGHAANSCTRKTGGFALGDRPVPVDDRAARDDPVLFVPSLQLLLDPNVACSLLTPGDLLDSANRCIAGFNNYKFFLTDPKFFQAMGNSLILVGWVLGVSVVGGTLLALLLDQAFYGRGVVRIMMIAPFLVMPTVSALVWQNMLMDPVSGFFHSLQRIGFAAD